MNWPAVITSGIWGFSSVRAVMNASEGLSNRAGWWASLAAVSMVGFVNCMVPA